MPLRELFSVVRSRWRIVVVAALVGVLVTGVQVVREPRVYTATSSVFFSVSIGRATSDLTRGFGYVEGLVGSYAQLATQAIILTPVIESLKLDTTPRALAQSVRAEVPLDTVLLEITVSSTSPDRAANVANAVAKELSDAVAGVAPGTTKSTVAVSATTVSPAAVPTTATSPRPALSLTTGLFTGGGIGVLLALLRDILDARVRGRRDAQRLTGLPVIGTLVLPIQEGGRRNYSLNSRRVAEQARELRTNFQHVQADGRLHSVVFASAVEERVTMLAVAGLGMELAQSGVRTIMVDADLRRPSLTEWFGVEGAMGLASVLTRRAAWRDVIQNRGQLPLSIIPAGTRSGDLDVVPPPDVVKDLVEALALEFDVVLIKVPPVLLAGDGLLYAGAADAAFIVMDGPAMRRRELSDEVHALLLAKANLLGVVITE